MPLPQLDLDTYLYAKIASRVADGDWMPLRDGEWLIDKPPLQFWLMGGSIASFGVSNATIRAWHIAVAFLLLAATVLLAREAGLSTEDAALAALVLATSVQFLYQAIVPQDDMPMAAFATLAVAFALQWRRTGRLLAAVLCGGSLALAVLAKGIAACAVFALAVGALAWMSRRPRRGGGASPAPGTVAIRANGIAAAVVVFAAIVLPWFAVGVLREGMEFVRTFLIGGTIGVGRYFRPAITTPPPYPVALFAYVPLLFMAMLPWSPALVAGLVAWARRRAHGCGDSRDGGGGDSPPAGVRTVALWALGVFVVLSLSASDRVFRYLLPCLPPFAVYTAWTLRRMDADGGLRRIAAWVALLPGVLVFGFGLWWLWSRFPSSQDLLLRVVVPVFAALSVGLGAFGLAMLRGRTRLAIASASVAAAVGWAVFEWGLGAHSQAIDPWPAIARIAARSRATRSRATLRHPSDVALIGGAALGRHALVLYLGAEPSTFEAVDRVAGEWRQRPLVVVVPVERSGEVEASLIPAPARVHRDLGRIVVFLNAAAAFAR